MRTPARRANRRSSACRTAPRCQREARAPRTACRPGTKKNSLARRGFAILLRISFRRGKIERRLVAAGREGAENENEANGAAHGDADNRVGVCANEFSTALTPSEFDSLADAMLQPIARAVQESGAACDCEPKGSRGVDFDSADSSRLVVNR